MTDKKDAPTKAPGRRAAEATGTGSKRPFSTIDLKATEVPASQPKQETATGAIPAADVEDRPTESETDDSHAAAAARIAAASAQVSRPTDAPQPEDIDPARAPASNESHFGGSSRFLYGLPIPSFATHLAAGVLGGLLALLGSWVVAPDTPPPTPVSTALDAQSATGLESRLAALEEAGKTAQGRSLDDVAKRVQAAEASLANLDETKKSIGSTVDAQNRLAAEVDALRSIVEQHGRPDAVEGRIAKLEQRLASFLAAANADPQAAARAGQLAEITGKLSELETAMATRLAALRKDQSQEMETRIAAVTEASDAAKSGIQRLERELAAAKSDVLRIGQRADVMKAGQDRLDQSVRALQSDAGGLKTSLDELRSDSDSRLRSMAKPGDIAAAVTPLQERLSGLDHRIEGVLQADNDRKTNAERVVLALELGNLKRALERGGAYATELAAVKRVAGGAMDLGALEAYQQTGIPTQSQLVREFRNVANGVLDADAEQPDASLVDRLLSGARTIVRVRKVAPAEDDKSSEAIISRIETALKDGRLSDVLAEAKGLPAKAAGPAQDWLKKIEARQAIDAAVAKIDVALKNSLAGAPSGQPGARR